MDKRAEGYKRRLQTLQSNRSTFNAQWDEVSNVIRPSAALFSSNYNQDGQLNNRELYDSVGVHANELLASGFYSLLTSPSSKWFELATTNPYLNEDRDVRIWLSEVSRIMYFELQRPQTGFATALHEAYIDYGAYGNGVLFATEQPGRDTLLIVSLPLQESYFVEGDNGRVIALYRQYKRSVQQLVDKFGLDAVSESTRRKFTGQQLDEKVDVLHVIEPNNNADQTGRNTRKPYSSIYIELEAAHILSEGGFEEQPFMAARFYKTSYEVYGRGPGYSALPDLKMLQQITKTTLRGAQKIVDPPLLAPDNGFVSPLRTIPGGITYYKSSNGDANMIRPLTTNGRPELGEDLAQGIRNRVREMFYVDQLQLNEGPQMTATEVLQRTEEKMRLMGPVVGRAQTELLGPLLERVFGLLNRAGKFPEAPPALSGQRAKLKIVYTSPIAKSQEQTEANSLLRVTQLIAPFMSVDPTVMDVFDSEAIVRGVGDMYAINPKFYRSDREVQAMRQQRADQNAQAQQIEMMKSGGQGLNSLASGLKTLGTM